jgi:disulfide bond formation protein DsbB
MTETILTLNFWVATGTLILEIFVAFFTLWFVFARESLISFIKSCTGWRDVFTRDWSQMLLIKVFAISLFSSIMTLVYSEGFGVLPCGLCWFERIFMYGILVMSAVGLYRKEAKQIFPYITTFAWLGGAVAIYHHFLQMTATATSHLPCPASGGDCVKRIIFEYGHITFPWMAVVVFATIILTSCLRKDLEVRSAN